MDFSGYDEIFREQVITSALNAYDQMIEKDQQGIEPLYRPSDWRSVGRGLRRMRMVPRERRQE